MATGPVKTVKPPETSAAYPLRPHRRDQLQPARSHRDAVVQNRADGRFGQTRQQTDARDQRFVKVQFAVHGLRGDGRDAFADPREIGQLVDAFLIDHRAVHIGQQDGFAAPQRGLDHQIEALGLQFGPDVPEVRRLGFDRKLGRDAGGKRDDVAAVPTLPQRFDQRRCQIGTGRGSKDGDGEHGGS